jgi:GNAT superfamily N-acetyltransferase
MIRPCEARDIGAMVSIVNDAAQAYRGVIPADRWHDPYMPKAELEAEIGAGVRFWVWADATGLAGLMGLQDVEDATLIRHAYVATAQQGRGIGSALMKELVAHAQRPLLVGTWAAAHWAIRFYERHGFVLVDDDEKNRLLDTYWSIPSPQREASVVLTRRPKRLS